MQKKYLMNELLKNFVSELANNSDVTRNDLDEVLNAFNNSIDVNLTYCKLYSETITIEKTKDNLIKLCDMLHFAFNGQNKINNLQLRSALSSDKIKYTVEERNDFIFSNSEVNDRMKKVYKDNNIILCNAYFTKCNSPRYTTVIDVQKTLAHFEKILNKL